MTEMTELHVEILEAIGTEHNGRLSRFEASVLAPMYRRLRDLDGRGEFVTHFENKILMRLLPKFEGDIARRRAEQNPQAYRQVRDRLNETRRLLAGSA